MGLNSALRVERRSERDPGVPSGLSAVVVPPDNVILRQLKLREEPQDILDSRPERHVYHGDHAARCAEIL